MDTFTGLEMEFLLRLQSLHSPVMDKIMIFVTKLGDIGFIWIVLGVVLTTIKKTRYCGITLLFSLALGALAGELILKNIVQRLRPCQVNDAILLAIAAPNSFSFPSGHTCASFCATTVLFIYKKSAGICALLLAITIAFSRMYLFVHFPTDIIGGIILGVTAGIFGAIIINKCRKYVLKPDK